MIRPGGVLAVAYRPPAPMATFGMRGPGVQLLDSEQVEAELRAAGFAEVQHEAGTDSLMAWACAVARLPPPDSP